MTARWIAALLMVCVAPLLARDGRAGTVVVQLHRDADTKGPLPVLRFGKWGYITASGTVAIAPQFEEARFFYGGRAAVRLDGRWGYIDTDGRLVVPPRFSAAERFSDGLAYVRWPLDASERTTSGYIDPTGQIVVRCEAGDRAVQLTPSNCGRPYSGGYVAEAVEVFRCVDAPGNPKEYPCRPFSEGLAAVCCDGDNIRYVDATGRWAFDTTLPRGLWNGGLFVDGIALVDLREIGAAYIDRTGRVVAPVRSRN